MTRKQVAVIFYCLGLGSLVMGIIGALGYNTFSPVAGVLIWLLFQEVARLLVGQEESEE